MVTSFAFTNVVVDFVSTNSIIQARGTLALINVYFTCSAFKTWNIMKMTYIQYYVLI